ncbi:uncharacterized protein FOMMEDRAFT_159347 [Fomitiporia mediterranea MF3/22]|uniref:uncharacterized protein n=1 Tax=Fomitiporia mediterranea (strain MF3/22) TaxID=694068 RepID=UPI0004408499|nr:uncharacterized protein FOMMEDRAFT_159347 [Fomitiporia mediterranea MF3/22]EJD00599.1 hypothetical protein FOMMEDRAFT_159347 [Fomitiporia mediterranea MF3/22]
MRLAYPLTFALVVSSCAGVINVTIDDEFGDPMTGEQISYYPSTFWQQGADCGACTAQPTSTKEVYMGTWHDTMFYPASANVPNSNQGQILGASVNFTGTAVFVKCILTGSSRRPNGNTDLTFYLDNEETSTFRQTPNGDTTYEYNQTVFSATGLSDAEHNIRLETGHAGQQALVLLDSIIYTSTNDSIKTVNTVNTIPTHLRDIL